MKAVLRHGSPRSMVGGRSHAVPGSAGPPLAVPPGLGFPHPHTVTNAWSRCCHTTHAAPTECFTRVKRWRAPAVQAAGWDVERGVLHAIEHAVMGLVGLITMAQPKDFGGQCTRRKGDGWCACARTAGRVRVCVRGDAEPRCSYE